MKWFTVVEPTSGVWRVKTENSVYYFDMDKHIGFRIPDDITAFPALRRDGRPFVVHELLPIEIGEPLVMLITVEEGVMTKRTTSWVLGIVGITGCADLDIFERMLDAYDGN